MHNLFEGLVCVEDETGYGFGMQNKDMVAVTEKGCELLSSYTNTDRLIRVG